MSNFGFAQFEPEHLRSHALEGQTIRSYAISPWDKNEIVVGIKGSEPGDGKVLLSKDFGKTFTPLNNDLALCVSCEDVQAVCFMNPNVIIAGTWKNGLFYSKNKGKTFTKLEDFPAVDIRAIKRSNKGLMMAATTTHGIMTSEDGKTWTTPHEDSLIKKLPSWSLLIDPDAKDIMYAMTFGKGIWKTINSGDSWKQVYHKEGLMIWDMDFHKSMIYAIASDDTTSYLVIGRKGDKKWSLNPLNFAGGVAINVLNHTYYEELLIGTWNAGAYSVNFPGDIIEWTSEDLRPQDSTATTKLFSDDSLIYNFTWGDGLYTYNKEEQCVLNIPQYLYPNGDTDNPYDFYISSNCILDYLDFKLYNRWGELLVEEHENLRSLNEKIQKKSSELKSETYVYWAKVSFENEQDTIDTKGHLSVLR